jgi:hypothetical protein
LAQAQWSTQDTSVGTTQSANWSLPTKRCLRTNALFIEVARRDTGVGHGQY